MNIIDYNECTEIFWNEDSLHYTLYEERVWEVEKYWSLEYYLIKLAQSLGDTNVLPRRLAADFYYLSRRINVMIENQKLPANYWEAANWKLEGFDEEEGYYCLDRFNHIMRIIWGRIPFEYDQSLLQNPLFKNGN